MYKGVVQLSPDNWAYTITIDGQERQMDGEPNARSAADCYDARMRMTRCRVVNTVLYRNEVQAVAGEDDETTLQRHYQARAAARPARSPKPPPAHPLYKGVQQTGPTDFAVIAYVCMTRRRLGVYKTAEQAARVYDTEMRRQGVLAVNFPRLGTRECKAVPDAADAASPPARRGAMAAAPVPHSPDELAVAAQVAAPLLARLRQEDAREQQLPRAPPPAVKPQKVAKPALVPLAPAAAALSPPQELRVDDDVAPDDHDAMTYDDDDEAVPVDDDETSDEDDDAAPGDAALADHSGGSGMSRRQRRPSGYYSALMSQQNRTPDVPLARAEAKPPSALVLAALRGASAAASAAAPPVPSPPAAAEMEVPEAELPPVSCSLPKRRWVPGVTELPDDSWTKANGDACAAQFKGVEYSRGAFRVMLKGHTELFKRTFPTAQAAADAYDAIMREQGCLVVNTLLHEGEIQAVRGQRSIRTMRLAAMEKQQPQKPRGAGDAHIGASLPSPAAVDAPAVAAAPPPLPPPAAAAQPTHPLPDADPPEAVLPPFSLKVTLRVSPPKRPGAPDLSEVPDASLPSAAGRACAAQFKGIDYRGGAFFILGDLTERTFPTAQAAADAYDALMREQGCFVVNTPLFDGDIQAVRGETADFTMRQAAEEKRRAAEEERRQKRHKGNTAAAGGAGAGAGNARIGATPPSKKPPALPTSPPAVDAPVVAAAPWGLPVPLTSPPVAPPCDLILPSSMVRTKRPAEDAAPAAAEAAPPSKRARADSSALRDASPNGSMSANKACSADAPPPQMPVPAVAAPPADLPPIPVPMPLAPPVAPAHDLPAFLRRIAPPLRDLDAALAAADADSSLTVAALRDSLRGPPDQALMGLHLASELLGLQCGGDKLALLQALQGAPPATGAVPTAPEDAADELAAFLRGIKLVDIEAAIDAAADSGLTVAALRRAARQGGPHAALCVRLIFTMLRVTRGGDKLTLQRALMSA